MVASHAARCHQCFAMAIAQGRRQIPPPSLPLPVVPPSTVGEHTAKWRTCTMRQTPLETMKHPERGSPTVSQVRKSPKIVAWCVPCPLATHPVAVLLSCAGVCEGPHYVVAGAAQRKQGGA
jgi:hypothetical protein